jgi:cell wall-associated NlpC family hydrolase
VSLSRGLLRVPALGAASAALAVGTLFAPTLGPTAAQAATVTPVSAAVPSAASPSAAGAAARAATLRTGVMVTAASLKGRPYRYGATGPSAFDCSGYTRYVFARNGISLPRTSRAQYRATKRISKAGARKGDLVFFGRGSAVYHVGIYAGNGMMWHSPRAGKSVRLIKIWTSNWSAGRII